MLAVIDWGSVWTTVVGGLLLVVLGGMLSPSFWKWVGKPLGITCRGLFTIASQNRQNSLDIVALKKDVHKNGEQNAIQIDQNKLIMDAMNIAYIQADPECRAQYVSDAWCVMSGMARDKAVADNGNGWLDSIQADDQGEMLAVLKDVIDNDRSRRVAVVFGKTGLSVTAAINPIWHDDEVAGHRIRFLEPHNDAGLTP